jgi:signal transduction histidine kinase
VASHELKTPLTTLKASLQLINRVLQNENISEKLKLLVEKSNYNLQKLTTLVDDLLSSTKIEQGQLILNKSIFTVAQLIDDCCDHVRLEGTHELVTSGDLSLQVSADWQKIDQVMINLVNNAVKYAPKSAKILIHISKENDMVKVSVQDFGIGIPAEKLPQLFDRFYRVDNSGVQYSGLGLGLYISAEIVKKHGGILAAESTIGHGSKFWFTLPALI